MGNSSSNTKVKEQDKEKKSTTPDPAAAMLFFFIATSIYCIVSIFLGGGDTKTKIIMKVCYILFIITGEYFINLNLSSAVCGGTAQWKPTLMITVVPWLLIFGVLHLFLVMFPGWLSPFSNTFGYFVVRLMGLPDLMKEILAPVGQGSETERALLSVTTDNSLLINQFFTENVEETKDANGIRKKSRPKFDDAWEKLSKTGIIKPYPDPKEGEKSRKALYKFVEMKYTISEYVWNMLTGLLVTSVSYNYILNAGCDTSPDEMQRRHDKYEAEEKNKIAGKEETKSNEPNYRNE